MSQSTVAKRYAQALFEVAKGQNILNEVSADMKELLFVVENNTELFTLLNNPKLSVARKKDMVSEIFVGATSVVVNAIKVLIEKKRVNDIGALASNYLALADAAQGTAVATVYSTRELTGEEQAEISASFGQLVGKQSLTITNKIDASLIGGVRVQIGNYIFDNTVASKLEGLKRTLVG